MKKKMLICCLAFWILLAMVGCGSGNTEPEPTSGTQPTQQTEPTLPPDPIDLLTDHQRNVLAMYNHLAVVTQEINDTSNGRLFLEEVYAALVGNTNPESVDELTEEYLMKLLDSVEAYRINDVKRERIQYIYEENKANLLMQAVPDAASAISGAVASSTVKLNPTDLAKAAIGSVASIPNGYEMLEQEYLKDGWELDDEQKSILHESRKEIFQYLLDVVQNDGIPGEMVLSEAAVKGFVKWSNENNVHQRIRFFETEEETYKYYAGYWRELVSCYYEIGEYEKCLQAMDRYEHIREELFLRDYYYAQTIPMAVVSAHVIYDTETYVPIAERYLELLTGNALNTDWSLRYFAAQMYIDLYNKVGDESYLREALELEIDNVNHLIEEQRKLNTSYVSGIEQIEASEDADANEVDIIADFMNYLKELRKVELPPVYEPLTINCELMFALAEKLNITTEEKNRIEGILRGNGDPLFLSEALEVKYSFVGGELYFTAKFEKDTLILPVSCVSENSIIRVTVTTDGATTIYEDWNVEKVKRPSEDFATFAVTYTSKEMKDQVWNDESTVKVEIIVNDAYPDDVVELSFEVSNYVDLWLIPDTVEFAQVEN